MCKHFDNFPSMHCHPQSLDSASTPEAFAKKEVELGSGSLTCTDHGSLGAAYKIYDLAKKNNLTPVVGCLLPGQEIHTIDGVKAVEDVQVGDLVLTHRGRYRKVTKTMSRPYDGNIKTIWIARNGSRGLSVTTEHPVLISDKNGNTHWKTPDEIRTQRTSLPITNGNKWDFFRDLETTFGKTRRCTNCKKVKKYKEFHKQSKTSSGVRSVCKECCKTTWESYVVIPKLCGEGKASINIDQYLPEFFVHDNKTLSSHTGHVWEYGRSNFYLDADFAYFLGLFFAEGSSSIKRCSLTFNIKENNYANFCVRFLMERFNVNSYLYPRADKGTLDVYFCSKPLALILQKVIGKGAHNKKVPREILEHPDKDVRQAFLSGALDGDGKKANSQYIKLSSVNGIWSLKTLIADAGTYSEVKFVKQKRFLAWSVEIQKKPKWQRSCEFKDLVAIPIREITTSHYAGLVYNFTVEEDNSYVSDFVLHNCEGYFRADNCPILIKNGIQRTDDCPRGVDKLQWKKDHPEGSFLKYNKYYHITLGFRDFKAYKAGVRLLSRADAKAELHGSERKPLFDWNDLEELGQYNVTAGTGCLVGMTSRHLVNNLDLPQEIRAKIAKEYFERLHSIFKDRLFAEVFPHNCSKIYVQGVFIDTDQGTLRYRLEKTLRTDKGEFKAKELADNWNPTEPQTLLATSHYKVWTDLEKPAKILNIYVKDGFYDNECSPWSPGGDFQWGANMFAMGMAKRHGVPIILSDDSHFVDPSQKLVQDIRLSNSGGNWKFYNSYHRMSSGEAYEYFKNKHNTSEAIFESWIENNKNLLEGFKGFKFDNKIQLPDAFYPKDTLNHTLALIKKHGKMLNDPIYRARLKQEIDLFHRNGIVDLLSYFMIDEEVCEVHSNQGVLTGPGRGSACGTLLAYLLNITQVDPIKYGLSLDRFLTLDRIKSNKYPDIDLDLCNRDILCGTEEKPGWLQTRFGDCCAQLSVMSTLKIRNAVKDVARALLGSVPPEIEELTKKFVMPPQGRNDLEFIEGWSDDEGNHAGSIETDQALITYIQKYPSHWEIVRKALSLPRQMGRHASAFVVASVPISEFIPMTTVSGVKVTAFSGPEVEGAGGLKMDWLVVNCLNDIQKCIKLVRERGQYPKEAVIIDGRKVPPHRLIKDPVSGNLKDVWDLPEDMEVFKDISSGNTETIFQFNTNSAVGWLKHFDYKRPDGSPCINSIASMAAFTALDRPGPLNYMFTSPENPNQQHNLLVEYARRVRGLPGSPDIFPIFDQLLPETNSLIIFQESLQKVYQALTGCTGAEAEEFRSFSAKKKPEKMAKAYTFFMETASQKVGKEAAQQIWDGLVKFAQYSFNLSHAVAYCVISYACAFLKHYYPLEWWTSIMSNATKEEINEKFWKYCGHLVLLPDIVKSKADWEIEGDKIRAPVSMLFGMGETAHKQLSQGLPYTDLRSFCQAIVNHQKAGITTKEKEVKGELKKVTVWGKSALNIGKIQSMIIAGCMDSFFPPDTSEVAKLDAYHDTMKELFLKEGKKYVKSKKKMPQLDALGRYQAKKAILPPYGEDLKEILIKCNIIPEYLQADGHFMRIKGDTFDRNGMAEDRWDPVVNGERLSTWETEETDKWLRCGIIAYIEEKDSFQYANKTKTALKFHVEVCGYKMELVCWPDDSNKIPEYAQKVQKGCIVAVVIVRSPKRPGFSIRDMKIVREPLGDVDSEEEKE